MFQKHLSFSVSILAWKVKKTGHVVLDDNIPVAETYREHFYFVFNLGEPKLLEIERIF